MAPVASAEISVELPHYNCNLAVGEGVLGPTTPGKGAVLDLQELCSTGYGTCTQSILGPHPVVKQMLLIT